MRKTIFILMFMCAGLVSAQIGGNPSNFNNGIALPNATNEGDTISLATKIPIMDNSGKINYFANLSALDGMFGAEWGGITGTLSDQTDLQSALDSKLSRNINETTTGSLTFESGSDNLKVQFNGVIFNRGLSYLNATVNTQSLRIGGLTGTNWNEIQLNAENGVTTNGNFTATGAGEFGGTVSGSDPVNSDDFVTKGYAESNFATVESGTFTPTLVDVGGGATYSFTINHARYVKKASEVTLYIRLTSINTTGSPSGVIAIDNIPFTAAYDGGGSFINFFGGNITYYSIYPIILAANDYIQFQIQQALDASISGTMNGVTFTGAQINLMVTYITND